MCLYINSPALEGAGPRSRGFAPIADIPIARTPTGALLGATRRRVALARRAPSPRARGRARRPARGLGARRARATRRRVAPSSAPVGVRAIGMSAIGAKPRDRGPAPSSAGLLIYRHINDALQVLLVHPG